MLTILAKDEASDELKGAVQNWYTKGRARLEAICQELERGD